MFDIWCDTTLQSQKWKFWEKDPKKLKNITILHFMTTFHNVALEIGASFKLKMCLSTFCKLEKLIINVKTYWDMLKMQQTTMISD